MNWLSAIAAVSKLFGALTGLYRDWGLRRAGAKEARLSALEAEGNAPNGSRKLRPIWILLMTTSLISACANINAPADGCGWVKPISVAEEDRLTTTTKRALLAHNEAWSEFCN